MRRARAFWSSLAMVAMLSFAGVAPAQPRFGLSPDAYAAYQRWVLAMCIGGDEERLATELRRHASELGPAFEQAIAQGPAAEDLRAVREAADTLYERRRTSAVDDVAVTGVSRAELQRFRSLSREAFVQDQVRRFSTGYRANAVAALGILGDERSRTVLQRIARATKDPLAPAAREALRATGQPR